MIVTALCAFGVERRSKAIASWCPPPKNKNSRKGRKGKTKIAAKRGEGGRGRSRAFCRVKHFIKVPTLLRSLLPADPDPLLGTPSSLLGSRPSLLGGSSPIQPLSSWRWAARRPCPPGGAAGHPGLLSSLARPPGAGRPQLARPTRRHSRAPGAPVFSRSPAQCRPPLASSRLRGRASPVLDSGANPRFFSRPPTCLPWARLRQASVAFTARLTKISVAGCLTQGKVCRHRQAQGLALK
jgi:hypothetical protein